MFKSIPTVYFVLIIALYSFQCFSQVNISGRVFSEKDSSAIYGASVYLDGTSIGTATNKSGKFSLNLNRGIQANLIISSMGFEQIEIPNISEYNDKQFKIFLREKEESLETVFLEADPWTREKKMRIFKRQFLGHHGDNENCKIINEDDIDLRYSPSANALFASADEPLLIENFELGYKIKYSLVDFEVKFEEDQNKNATTVSVYYAGTSYFEDLSDDIPRRILKRRKQAYLGSALHFMRSLKNKTLEEQEFLIYKVNAAISPENVFELEKLESLTLAKPLLKKIRIRYNKEYWSKMIFEDDFLIDDFGNFSPPTSITFSGAISSSRILGMLPLNYKLGK